MLLRAAVALLLSLAPACQVCQVAADGVVEALTGYPPGQPPPARQASETAENEIVGPDQRPITAADNVRFLCTCLATAVAL